MAVVYFTNNASTGAGSLVAAILSAAAGDVIRPDESVFERGSIIEIALSSSLAIGKALTINGGPYRVRINGGGSTACANITDGATVEFVGFDFVGSSSAAVTTTGDVTFDRCRIAGANGDGVAADGKTVTLKNSVVCGNNGRPVSSATAVVDGSTIIGNVESLNAGSFVASNSIFPTSPDVAPSLIGFVAAPPDNFSGGNWTANAWQNWDLRLLDDAAESPSPYRDAGAVAKMTDFDVDGNFRGRETNGVATCSPGAYETLQADLFWVGRDANGAEVASPSWVKSDGWAASRFATVSGDVAPRIGLSVFADGSIVFEAATLRVKKIIVGGAATLGFNNSGSASLTLSADSFDIGVGATTRGVSGTQRLQITDATLRSRFADDIYIGNTFFFNSAENLQIAPTSQFAGVVSGVKLYKNGVYNSYNLQIANVATIEGDSAGCRNVYISFQNSTARLAATGTPRVSAATVSWTTPSDATGDFSALEAGSTPIVFAPSRSATVAGNGSRNDFLIDVSNAQTYGTLALTLTGQTVNGDAPSSAVALTGSATIDERGLTSQTLTLNADAVVALTGDAQLVAVSSATVSTAIFTGNGTVFAPTPPPTGATFNDGAVWANTSAGVTNVNLSPEDATSVVFVVSKTASNENIVAQYSINGTAWQSFATSAAANEYELTVTPGATVSVRVAGPRGWIIRTASLSAFLPVWTVTAPTELVTGIANAFEIATGGSNTGNNSFNLSGWGIL